MAKLLLIEDDVEVLEKTALWMKRHFYTVETAASGSTAQTLMTAFVYDLIVIDWQLPEISGVELVAQFRNGGGKTPILMLTGKSALTDKVEGFRAGADDYLTKPFELQELLVRVEALLRRSDNYTGNVIQRGTTRLDIQNHSLYVSEVEVHLQPKEFAVLEHLMKHPKHPFSAEVILERVWHNEDDATIASVRACIKKLRKKLLEAKSEVTIDTVHKIGYQLIIQ